MKKKKEEGKQSKEEKKKKIEQPGWALSSRIHKYKYAGQAGGKQAEQPVLWMINGVRENEVEVGEGWKRR